MIFPVGWSPLESEEVTSRFPSSQILCLASPDERPAYESALSAIYWSVAMRAPTQEELDLCSPEGVPEGAPQSLRGVTAEATSVWVTKVFGFDPSNRKASPPLLKVLDLKAIEALHRSLDIDASSLANEYAWMTPGDVS